MNQIGKFVHFAFENNLASIVVKFWIIFAKPKCVPNFPLFQRCIILKQVLMFTWQL